MRMLCVTSCTAKKANVPGIAGVFYEGLQHKYVLDGIHGIRQTLGAEAIDFNIISAKYGLLNELDIIEPYDVTFNNMKHDEIIKRAKELNIHRDLQRKVADYDMIFYLLGLNYLKTLELPFHAERDTTHLFLMSPRYTHMITKFCDNGKFRTNENRKNYFTFDCGSQLSIDLGIQNIALKGYIFKRLGEHIKEAQNELIMKAIKNDPQVLKLFIDTLVLDRQDKIAQAKEAVSKQLELF